MKKLNKYLKKLKRNNRDSWGSGDTVLTMNGNIVVLEESVPWDEGGFDYAQNDYYFIKGSDPSVFHIGKNRRNIIKNSDIAKRIEKDEADMYNHQKNMNNIRKYDSPDRSLKIGDRVIEHDSRVIGTIIEIHDRYSRTSAVMMGDNSRKYENHISHFSHIRDKYNSEEPVYDPIRAILNQSNGYMNSDCRYKLNETVIVHGLNIPIFQSRPAFDMNDFSMNDTPYLPAPAQPTELVNVSGVIRYIHKYLNKCWYFIKLEGGQWAVEVEENFIYPLNNTPGYPGASPGYPGASPGYPGASPGYPGASPGYPGASPGYPGPYSGYPGTSSYYPMIQQTPIRNQDKFLSKNKNNNMYSDDDTDLYTSIDTYNISIYKSKINIKKSKESETNSENKTINDLQKREVKRENVQPTEIDNKIDLEKDLLLGRVYAKPNDTIAKILDKVDNTYPNTRCIISIKGDFVVSLPPEDYNKKISSLRLNNENIQFYLIN